MARDEKRRDPGEFYPGGSVWVKPGQSQPQGGDVKHSDFADMAEKEGMTLKEVGGMVNTLVRKLKGGVSLVAIVSCLASLVLPAHAGDVPLSPDMDFGDIHPTNKLKAVVEASGAISGVDTNSVKEIVSPMIGAAIAANEKTGTDEQIVRGSDEGWSTGWNIRVSSAETADMVDWGGVHNTPTNLSGYGIEDGATKDELEKKADEFTEWEIDPPLPVNDRFVVKLYGEEGLESPAAVIEGYDEGNLSVDSINVTRVDYPADAWTGGYAFTATRKRVLRTGDVEPPGNYAAVSNAAMSAISQVTNTDANLIYTITSDGAEPRFYFTPVGAINPED